MKRSLTKSERLRKQPEIKSLFVSGRNWSCKGLKLWVMPNEGSATRVLFSPSRQFSNAVKRNETKRYGREIYRHIKYQIKQGYDIGFVFFPGEFTFQERQEQMVSLLRKSRVFAND
jgi:ribonuclease P protein component